MVNLKEALVILIVKLIINALQHSEVEIKHSFKYKMIRFVPHQEKKK